MTMVHNSYQFTACEPFYLLTGVGICIFAIDKNTINYYLLFWYEESCFFTVVINDG